MHEQLSFSEGVIARDEALAQVAFNCGDFMARGTAVIAKLPRGREMTGEDIRMICSAQGITPHHHNAWGSLIMNAVRMGLLVNTGRTVKMRAKSSHARRTSVYVKD